jgi:hypothetical protein
MNAGDNYNRPKVLWFNLLDHKKDWDDCILINIKIRCLAMAKAIVV